LIFGTGEQGLWASACQEFGFDAAFLCRCFFNLPSRFSRLEGRPKNGRLSSVWGLGREFLLGGDFGPRSKPGVGWVGPGEGVAQKGQLGQNLLSDRKALRRHGGKGNFGASLLLHRSGILLVPGGRRRAFCSFQSLLARSRGGDAGCCSSTVAYG